VGVFKTYAFGKGAAAWERWISPATTATALSNQCASSDYLLLYNGKRDDLLGSSTRIRDVAVTIIRALVEDPGQTKEAEPAKESPVTLATAA